MARELTQRGNIVGSAGYFAELNGNGLLKQIMRPQYSVRYEECIKDTARKVNTAVRTVLDDLKAHASVLYFMERSDLSRMETAIDQLERFCSIVGERLSDASDCRDYLRLNHRDTHLKSRASQRDLDDAMDILRGHGSYDLSQSRERILAELIRDGSHSEAYRYGKDGLRFAEDLMGRNGFDQIKDLYRMWQYRNEPRRFHGRWGYAVGTEQYLGALEDAIFGSKLRSGDLTQGDHNYGDSLVYDLQKLARDFNQDVINSPTDEFIVYENRQRMLEAAEQISRVIYYDKGWIERQLKLYQRLEDFNNRVIEFDTRGVTRARMAWENGKNVMYIEADVYFEYILLDEPVAPSINSPNYALYVEERRKYQTAWKQRDASEFERRVGQAITDFKLWAGNYSVFGGQDLKVEVTVNRVHSKSNAAVVFISNIGTHIEGFRSFATGQILPQIFGWNPNASKYMGLMTPIVGPDSSGTLQHSSLAAHEFGHWLGLQDAYHNDNAWMPIKALRFPLTEIDPNLYPGYDKDNVMSFTQKISSIKFTDKEIEMVVLAFKTGERQSYRKQFPWEEKSEAWK